MYTWTIIKKIVGFRQYFFLYLLRVYQNVNETKLSQIDSSSVTINGKTQSSLIASGTINNSDLKGPLLGKNISDLITLMQSKNTYVNVHSESHPDGEIRGQIS